MWSLLTCFGIAALTAVSVGCEPDADAGAEALRVRAVGEGFYWHFTYAGPDGVFDTADDRRSEHQLELPVGVPVELLVTSEDYIYSFRAPALGLLEVAVPDLTFSASFAPERVGSYALEIDPLCGVNFLHDNDTMGRIDVVERSRFTGGF